MWSPNSGVIKASFQLDGIEHWYSDAWKIRVNNGAISEDISFSRQFIAIGDMSGKGALV